MRGALEPGRAGRQRRRPRRRGAGAARVRARDGHPGRRDVHGQGPAATPTTRTALGAVGLQAGDYSMAGFDEADLVLAIGYDLVEHSPEHWNPDGDKQIICIDSLPAEIDEYFIPEVELIGDIYHVLSRLGEECRHVPHSGGSPRLRDVVRGPLRRRQGRRPLPDPAAARALRDPPGARAARTSSSRTSGCTSCGSGGCSRRYEPNTVLIANGLAGMGFAVPAAIAAKLVHPERKVVAVNGDGGFLMNCQELETAVRLKTPFVTVIWENEQFGSIVWKQDKKFGRHFGVDFTNPDFVKLAELVRDARVALRVRRRLRRAPAARRSRSTSRR